MDKNTDIESRVTDAETDKILDVSGSRSLDVHLISHHVFSH